MCIKREKKQHMERQVKMITTLSYIYIYNGEINTMFAINKWSQDRYTKRIMYLNRKKRREYINPHYIPQKI